MFALKFEKSWGKFRSDEVTTRLVHVLVQRMQESESYEDDQSEEEKNPKGETPNNERWWGSKRVGLVRKVFAAIDQDASGNLG